MSYNSFESCLILFAGKAAHLVRTGCPGNTTDYWTKPIHPEAVAARSVTIITRLERFPVCILQRGRRPGFRNMHWWPFLSWGCLPEMPIIVSIVSSRKERGLRIYLQKQDSFLSRKAGEADEIADVIFGRFGGHDARARCCLRSSKHTKSFQQATCVGELLSEKRRRRISVLLADIQEAILIRAILQTNLRRKS